MSHFVSMFLLVLEIECRSPDQVRYIIRMQNIYNSTEKIFINIFVTLLFIFIISFNI